MLSSTPTKPFKLRPAQPEMVDWMMEHKRCALWASMGVGKSSAALWAHELLRLYGDISGAPTLIVAPARVARDTWSDEAAKWGQFAGLDVTPLVGTPEERKRLLKLDRPIFTVSFETAPWLVGQWLERWPYRQVIIDECDRVKGFRITQGGMRAHQLGRVAHSMVDRWVNMGGTPATNGLKDLWGQTWYLDRGARLGKSFEAFKRRWFMPNWNGHGIQPMPFAEAQIHAALRDICLTVDAKDYYDLKEPIVTPIEIHLPKRAKAIYKDLETQMFSELSADTRIDAFNAAALTNKCMQLANGAVYTDHPKWEAIHDEKLDALKSIQAQAGGMPILVSYAFKSDKERILKAVNGAVDIATPAGMAAFRKGQAPVGVAHPASLGHGIDGLQNTTNILVRFGRDWNLGTQLQMLERIGPMRQVQSGHDRPVYVYDLVAHDTIDAECVASHEKKRSVQQALLDYMNRRRSTH